MCALERLALRRDVVATVAGEEAVAEVSYLLSALAYAAAGIGSEAVGCVDGPPRTARRASAVAGSLRPEATLADLRSTVIEHVPSHALQTLTRPGPIADPDALVACATIAGLLDPGWERTFRAAALDAWARGQLAVARNALDDRLEGGAP